jgi:hypothetical protein
MKKDVGVAYFLWCLSLGGWLGLHRFYLDKSGTGVLWFCTFGMFWMGSLYDLFAIPSMVQEYNHQHGHVDVPQPQVLPPGYGTVPMAAPIREVITREIIKIPCRYCGSFVDHTEPKCTGCGAPLMQYR